MTLRHLQIFNMVCEKMSITKAAEELNMTQPAVSIAIKELEVFYNTTLFDRIGRKIYLTETGTKLRNYTCDILSVFDKSVSDIRDANNLVSCKIGVNATIGESCISLIAEELRRCISNIDLHINIENNRGIERKLTDNIIDFAIIDTPAASHNISMLKIYEEDMVAVCSPTFTNQSKITVKQLGEIPLLLRENGSGCRLCVESELNRLGIQPNILSESISNQALISLAVVGLGVAILPLSIVMEKISSGALKSLCIEDCNFIRQYNLAFLRQKNLSPTVRRCINMIQDHFNNGISTNNL